MIVGADFVVNQYTKDALDETGLNMISFSMEPVLRDPDYFENHQDQFTELIRDDVFVFSEFPKEWDFQQDGEFTDEGTELLADAVTTFSRLGVDGHVFDIDYDDFTTDQFIHFVKIVVECAGNHANIYFSYNEQLDDEKVRAIMSEPGSLRFALDTDKLINGEFTRDGVDSIKKRLNYISASLDNLKQYYVPDDKRSEYPKDAPGRYYSNFLDEWPEFVYEGHDTYFKIDECSINEVQEFQQVADEKGLLNA